jgi:hypothetical protein
MDDPINSEIKEASLELDEVFSQFEESMANEAGLEKAMLEFGI